MRIKPGLALAALMFMAPLLNAAEYKLYYLGGQSNMEGFGYVSELSEAWGGPVGKVMIYTGRITEDGK